MQRSDSNRHVQCCARSDAAGAGRWQRGRQKGRTLIRSAATSFGACTLSEVGTPECPSFMQLVVLLPAIFPAKYAPVRALQTSHDVLSTAGANNPGVIGANNPGVMGRSDTMRIPSSTSSVDVMAKKATFRPKMLYGPDSVQHCIPPANPKTRGGKELRLIELR